MVALRGGIDLGGTKILAAIVDGGKAVATARASTPLDRGPEGVAETMVELLAAAAAKAGVEPRRLKGVGIGSPGAIDAKAGTVARVVNIPGWEDRAFALASAVGDRFGLPAAVGNDVDVATDAELRHGALAGCSTALGVFWGSGVGGGVVIDGRLFRGRGSAGEIGHVPVRLDGRRCACGNLGCMEAYAGRRSMERLAREAVDAGRETVLFAIAAERGRDHLSSGVWQRALDAGDALATELVDDALRALGAAIGAAINLIDVDAVALGGGMGTRLGPRYADRLAAEVRSHVLYASRTPEIRQVALGDLAGAVGASLLV